jgi:hypothetical protein
VILVDTSIWVDHLRAGDAMMERLLRAGQVLGHPHVTGEIALGHLHHRDRVLWRLGALPQAMVASDDEALDFIGRHALGGSGIGYVDVHLLASAHLTPDSGLWTRDRRLAVLAERLGVAAA